MANEKYRKREDESWTQYRKRLESYPEIAGETVSIIKKEKKRLGTASATSVAGCGTTLLILIIAIVLATLVVFL